MNYPEAVCQSNSISKKLNCVVKYKVFSKHYTLVFFVRFKKVRGAFIIILTKAVEPIVDYYDICAQKLCFGACIVIS